MAVLWLDAVGLAVFSVTGAETALAAGASPFVAVVMGVITAATFGGIIRDILGGEPDHPPARDRDGGPAPGALVLVAFTGSASRATSPRPRVSSRRLRSEVRR